MKEKIFNNIIFVIFLIMLIVISFGCLLIGSRIIPQDIILNYLTQNLSTIYTLFSYQLLLVLIGIVIFLFAVYLLWLKSKMAYQIPSVNKKTDYGEIKISTYSLAQIMLNILNEIEGINKIKPDIHIQKMGNIKTVIHLIVSPGCNIPDTANMIQQKLKEELPRVSGIDIDEIKINVEKIAYNEKQA